ncbi:MAG TPA: Rieske (2Fe-2S) protein [Candidatus Obscuribacterales bacterium]
MAEYVKVAKASEIAAGQGKAVEVGGRRIAILNCDNAYYALDDVCPHKGGPLSEGVISEGGVRCPWHGATFMLASGELACGPSPGGVQSYPLRVNGDDIEVEV